MEQTRGAFPSGPGGPLEGVVRQYRDSANLGSRLSLHERYGSGRVRWQRWVFDQLDLRPGQSVLEAGCGPGTLWSENLDRLPPCRLVLSDLSEGMAGEANRLVAQAAAAVADAQRLPFAGASFDLVAANHMLYHVPDVDAALSEFRRVLRPSGRLIATTNGANHVAEVQALVARHLGAARRDSMISDFSLESGRQALIGHFPEVRLVRPPAEPLRVTEVEPLLDYVRSMGRPVEGSEGDWAALAGEVAAAIERQGYFHVTRDAGAFVCRT